MNRGWYRFAHAGAYVFAIVLGGGGLGCDATLGNSSGDARDGSLSGDGPGHGDGGDGDAVDIHNPDWSAQPDIDPFRPLVRRLTRDELMHTVYDVLGVLLTEEEMAVIPVDRPLEGFVNIATSQTVLPEHVEGYSNLSMTVAGRFDWSGRLASWGVCTDSTDACFGSLVDTLGSRLFRRPLHADEQAALVNLANDVIAQEGATFLTSAGAILRAMLQSPQFLYRIENETAASTGLNPGDGRTVGGYEMATRLSYAVWGSAPDEALYAAAESGELDTREGILAQLTRMLLSTELARRITDRYMIDWGRLEALPDDGGLKDELIDSVVATYSDMLWEREIALTDVFTANQILLTPTLATNFGLPAAGEGLQPYDLSAVNGRIGLLTHPGLIAGMTNADGGAIVARGLFLQTQLFCKETPSPPAGIQDAIDAFVEELPETASDRYVAETRLERPECGNCHGGFDPLAYGLEQFDYQGRFRQADEHDNPLSTDGWIPGRVRIEGGDVPYQTMEELAQLLQTEPAVHQCLTEQHLKYALGRTFAPELAPLVEGVFDGFHQRGGTYQAMLESIAESDLFRKMKVE